MNWARLKSKFGNRRTPEQFWEWFRSTAGQEFLISLGSADPEEHNAAAQEIAKAVKSVHPDLFWGCFPPGEGHPGTFEVSAGGVRSTIPIVQELVAAAPAMGNCRVVAFKQPAPDFQFQIGGSDELLDASTVTCRVEGKVGELVNVHVYVPVPAGTPPGTIGELAFIALDHVIGEYAVMTKIGRVQYDSTLVAPPDVMPLRDLSGLI